MSDKGWFVPPSMRQGNHGPPSQHYQQHNGHGGGYNDYAPPPGPPPGYTQSSNGYGPPQGPPPGSYRPPPQSNYGNGGHHGYGGGPPPPQQPPRPNYGGQQQHNGYGPPQGNYGPPSQNGGGGGKAGGGGPWVAPRIGVTRLTRKSWLWTDYNHDGEKVCEVGPDCKGEAFYSCKFGMSGRTKLKTGPYDQDGPLVAEVAVKGFISSKYTPTFNGFETELKTKGYSLTGSVKIWEFGIPVNGRTEMFEWKPHDKSMTARLTDQKGWELKRKGAPEDSAPLVVYKDEEGNGFKTKSKMGTVEFLGPAAEGKLGDAFPNLVLVTLLNLRQQKHIENIASSVGG